MSVFLFHNEQFTVPIVHYLKIGNRENATIISHPLTVSIDYPEKRLQENTTYKLEGIILRKKILLTIYKERRSNKKAGLQVGVWEVR